MRLVRNLLRVYCYIFETILSLLALVISIVILAGPPQQIQLGWLPWPDSTLALWLLGLGLLGVFLVILALTGRLRFLLSLYALGALIVITRGLFLTSWRFNGAGELRNALWLVAGLFAAFIGSIPGPGRDQSGYRGSRL